MVSLRVDARKLIASLDRAPTAFRKHISTGLNKVGADFVGEVQRGMQLNVRTGALRNAVGWQVSGGDKLSTLALDVFIAGVPYARIQEFGGVIVPVRAKALTIPTEENRVGKGELRYPTAGAAIEAGAKIITIKKAGDTTGIIAFTRKRAGGGEEVSSVVFVLKRRVVLPGPKSTGDKSRLGFYDTWNRLADRRNQIMARAWLNAAKEITG